MFSMEQLRDNGEVNREHQLERVRFRIVGEETLKQRLITISDDKTFQDRIYPYFVNVAGDELPPIAIAGIIHLALDHYTLGDRSGPSSQLVRLFVPHFVDAMVEDPAGREAVRKILVDKL